MKIITLNTWGGRAGEGKILSFLSKHKNDTDVFCLQEIWSAQHDYLDGQKVGGFKLDSKSIMIHGLQEITALLKNFEPYFCPLYTEHYGLLMMVNKKFKVKKQGEVFVYQEKGYFSKKDVGDHARCLQYIELESNGKNFTVINFHGLWANISGNSKNDTPDRLLQSDNIVSFLKNVKTPVVFCGDFNLNLETESIKKLEDFGLRNLIRENNITSTRTSFYSKSSRFADYIFVSSDIPVNDFKVLPDEVSDHSPLLINFDLP